MKALPIYAPRNAFFFVSPEYYPGEMEQVAPAVSVLTGPLRFNQGIPYKDLSVDEELVEQKLINPDWTLNPCNARLDSVWFKLPGHDKLLASNVGLNVEDARFKAITRQQDQVVKIDSKLIPLVIGSAELVTWTEREHREGTPLSLMIEEDMYVRLQVGITGTINIADGHVAMLHWGDTQVMAVLDRKGRVLRDDEHGSLPNRIKEYFSQFMALGYMLDVDWLQPDPELRYEFEMVEECPAGKGLAMLVQGVVGAYAVEGYSADIAEPTADTYGETKLYLQPQRATSDALKPHCYVVVEENNGLQPGWVNVEFFALDRETEQMRSLGRFEKIIPHYVGQWAGAIGMFLIHGDHYGVNTELPVLVPKLTTYVELQNDPDCVAKILADIMNQSPME